MNPERNRLDQNSKKNVPLEKWGSYLSERQWGTVREDYSSNGDAWNYFPHDHARSRSYLWGEDGIGGLSDNRQNICFAVALWNGKDPILKERLFGLTNSEGNHGEDVKELYYYLDNSPTHSYMKMLYKYPIDAYPYQELIAVNGQRSKLEPEYELLDTGIFNNDRYHDVFVTYAKNNSEDICIAIEIINRSDQDTTLVVLPTLWLKNTWHNDEVAKPSIKRNSSHSVAINHQEAGSYNLYFQEGQEVLFTENETNKERIFNTPNDSVFVKDAFHEAICNDNPNLRGQLSQRGFGTKCAAVYELQLKGNSSQTIYLRLSKAEIKTPFDALFYQVFKDRLADNELFYNDFLPQTSDDNLKQIQRQAFAGLLWSKQYYHYNIKEWLSNNPEVKPLPPERLMGRNHDWTNLSNQDVLSMPDCWEYPWYAAWDLAFHCVTMALIDPVFAQNQLLLILREWYMNPSGQVPAYEWNFSDVNPPILAWSAINVYQSVKEHSSEGDVDFLKKIFQKLLVNFTWWISREDSNGNNLFNGGFLGLDNIAVIDRSNLPQGYSLEQVDATSWMAMYALNMMEMAIEIALQDKVFEDSIIKFYEHYQEIANSINEALWDNEDQFFYDLLIAPDGSKQSLKIRSIVGISALFAVNNLKKEHYDVMTDFQKKRSYFNTIESGEKYVQTNESGDILFSLLSQDRLESLFTYLFDENEFLATNGIRALSKYHLDHPFAIEVAGTYSEIGYVPGNSTSGMFGGNSNWRGPIWMPINYLIIKALATYGSFYGDTFKVDFPTHSGNKMNLTEIATALSQRLIGIFKLDDHNERIVHKGFTDFYKQEANKDLLLFYEYFHGDSAQGVGASHQTGWTAAVASLINSL